jgi:hypothetical protein
MVIYFFLALGIAWILYMTINHYFLASRVDTETVNEPEIPSAPVEDVSERLKNIDNPDSEKPFAKISNTSPVETQVIQNVTTETQIVKITSETPQVDQPEKKKKNYRKKRKPKTDENSTK